MMYGAGRRITADIIPDLSRQPEKIIAARELGELLMQRLSQKFSNTAAA
jgi:hypothetical protein